MEKSADYYRLKFMKSSARIYLFKYMPIEVVLCFPDEYLASIQNHPDQNRKAKLHLQTGLMGEDE